MDMDEAIDFARLAGALDRYDAARKAGAKPSRLETLRQEIQRVSGFRTVREARRALREA